MPSDKPLVHFVVDQEMLKQLDDFRFERRFQSRSAAIKWLLEDGLQRYRRATRSQEPAE